MTTICILIKDISDWLKPSEIYKNIDKTKDAIEIPINKYDLNPKIMITNSEDLYKYLEICRYWMVNNCPSEIYDYVLKNKSIVDLKHQFYDLPFISELEILTNTEYEDHFTDYAIKHGFLNLLKYLHKNEYYLDNLACNLAAKHGFLEILEYLHKNGFSWNENACLEAAKNGFLEILKYLHENGCSFDEDACEYASCNGHLDCLKYLHENNCPWSHFVFNHTAENGHLECLKYLLKNGCPWNENTLYDTIMNDHFECFKYLYDNGCNSVEGLCEIAAMYGNLEHCVF